jgi:hypothetical protein
MHVFTRRNALIGWIVVRLARRRLRQKLHGSASGARRRRAALGAGALATSAVAVGAIAARRSHAGRPRPA